MAEEGEPIAELSASYRLQFTPDFTFADGERIVPYLVKLGVSHIYASPVFRSQPGSAHGYDVLDHNEINPELGGRDGFDSLVRLAAQHGLGWIQDVVPNHMAYSPNNPLLADLFENGERSRFRDYFDIDWQTPYQSMEGRVFAPFLGDLYGEVLNRGELSLGYGECGFFIRYYEMNFPLRMETYRDVLNLRLGALEARLGREAPDMIKLLGVLYTLDSLEHEAVIEARVDKVGFVKRMLWELHRGSGEVRAYLGRTLDDFNGTPGDPDSFTPLNELHWRQVYRLSFWKVASEEINYRRFFSINDLICLRMERQDVFDHSHELLLRLVADGMIDGLRIDHIDGLYAPGEYLQRLRDRIGDRPIFVEKILHPGETLPEHWPVEGTTGYDTLNLVNGLFIDHRGSRKITSFYRGLTGYREEYDAALYEQKRRILTSQMAGDLDNLARYVRRVVGDDRNGIDITAPSLKRALGEVMVYLPVYRTYVTEQINRAADVDYITTALAVARKRLPHHGYELDYIERFLLLDYGEHIADETRKRWGDVVLRFQQFTGPLMAKGLEDTLMYGYVPLVSVNEVGGSPNIVGISPRDFHRSVRILASSHPRTMTASSTHDTKRGEDTRLRVSMISHHLDAWKRAVRGWRSQNKDLRRRIAGSAAPDANDEYLVYQTILGVVGEDGRVDDELRSRLHDYLEKALREAKRHTDWSTPNEAYEAAATDFLSGVLDRLADVKSVFSVSFRGFLEAIRPGFEDAVLAQQAVRLAMPGIPDTYRGAEFLDLTLVDPDNRRPVDWDAREAALERSGAWVDAVLAEGRPKKRLDALPIDERKLAVMQLLLRLRRDDPALFVGGEYVPLTVSGAAERLVAFARVHEERGLIVVARIAPGEVDEALVQLPGELASGAFTDLVSGVDLAVTDALLRLSDCLSSAPVALLTRARSS